MIGFSRYVCISSGITTEIVNCFGVQLKLVEGAGLVMPSLPPLPNEQFLPLTTPYYNIFLERFLNDPNHPTSSPFYCYLPSHPPPLPPPKILIIHLLRKGIKAEVRCRVYAVYSKRDNQAQAY